MQVNDPTLTATLAEQHDAYERALQDNDVEALTRFFWDSPHVVRFGLAEQLYGAADLRAYRQGHTPPSGSRRLARREICTFGPSCATIMSEIEIVVRGTTKRSRQSQTWIDLPGIGWKIVAAHVSAPVPTQTAWAQYADAAARTLDLPLTDEIRAGVVANLERTALIAGPLLGMPLPDDVEPAPVFRA